MAAWKVIIVLGLLGFCDCQRKQGRNIAVGSEGKTPANFDCPEEFGYYPHPTDCTQYYVCVFGGALLESCTGGLMYSHELQTCDWPRNVGCDGLDGVPISSPGGDVRVSVTPARSPAPERVRYTVVPTAQPQPVVSSRGQSRQLHATVHERVHERERVQDILSKQQQQQLYADADDVLPPAEEIENDRQQRVYRGQPSTVGQVQRDRDGLRHTNAIPSSSRAEKIGVISFGTAQQQPVQQYRNHSLYIDNSLTDDSTVKHRLKRHTKRRLAPIDLVTTADSSISWSRPIPVPVAYQPQVQQKVYHNHRTNAMELQPPRYNKQEYSAILPGGGQTEFQPFAPNQYKQLAQYIVPKPKPVVYQYFKQSPQPHQQYQGDNYAYFNIGGPTTPPTVMYASSNQQQQTYYHPTQQHQQQQQQQQQFQQPQKPVQYQQQYKPIVNTASHVQYNHKPVPEVEQSSPHPEKQPLPANHKDESEEEEEEEEEEDEEKEEEEEEEEKPNEKQEQSEYIKPEFPSPPPFFFKSTNKYEDIENPFADPNFDFDKFISKLKGSQESDSAQDSKIQTTENDSTEKDIQKPNVELKTPVAFSTATKKKVTPKPVPEEDYYYDDAEEEQEEEKPKKPYTKQEEEPRRPYQHQEEELPRKSFQKHEEVQRPPYQKPEQELPRRPYQNHEEELPRRPYQKHEEEELPRKSYEKHEGVQRPPYQKSEQDLPRRPYQNHEEELPRRPYQKHEEEEELPRKSYEKHEEVQRPPYQKPEQGLPRRPYQNHEQELPRRPYQKHEEQELAQKSYQKHEEVQRPLYQKPGHELPRRPYQNHEQELPRKPYQKHEEVQKRPYSETREEELPRSPYKKHEEEQRRPYQHPKEEPPKRPYQKHEEELPRKSYQKHEEISRIPYQKEENVPIKTISTTKTYPINKNPSSHPQINVHNNKNTQLSPVTSQTQDKKHKSSKINEERPHSNVKDDEEYEYYDDEYDYEEEEQQMKKPVPQHTTIKSVIKPIIKQLPKITNPSLTTYKNRPNYEVIQKTQNPPVIKPIKYVEKTKDNKPSTTKHTTSSSPRTTDSTQKITTIKFPKLQTRPLTTTLRSTKDFTTRKTKKDSRLEESVNTQSHSIGSQSTPSGRTLYNGSQHYDPQQYDPYYTLYEDDVELYRDVDYSPQQQYTSNRAQPQQVYRGTPAPIAVPVQSTVQEETVPQRNSAYYSTQAQDVYSVAQDYAEDNYNTQVDDTASYRQPSRQPSRGDRNELSYYVESTPKSTTTIRTTTTTTTTTPRPIPVKQSVVPARSPIIAANQTRPQSIIITLSATPGQNSSSPTSNTTDIDSSSSRFVSLSTGFNLRRKDSEDPTPVTYKPHLSDGPAPFSLTKLPDNETKSIVFRLSSRLTALSPNVSDESTETPSKREVVDDAHVKTTDSTHVVPTTYSPSKAVLASILQKDNLTENKTENEERLVSILPRKVIVVNQKPQESQRKSVIIENPERNTDKPVKTIVRKLTVKIESTTPISFVEKSKERKIISKIHFGIPQTYTASPDKINNLASTPSTIVSTSDFQNAEESSRRPITAHYITTDLTSTQKPAKFTSTTETIIVQSTEDVSEEISTPRSRSRFSFSPKTTTSTTERGNIVKYTPNIFDTEYIDSIEHSTTQKPHSRFNFNYNIHPTTERTRYSTSTTETLPENVEENSTTERNKFSVNSDTNPSAQRSNYVRFTPSTTETTPENIEQINNTERSKYLFNTKSNPSTQRTNFVKYSPSTSEASTENSERISSTERTEYLFNSNANPTNQRTNFVRYTPTTAETSTENIEVSTQRTNLYKYTSSITDTSSENVEQISSTERNKYLLNSNPSTQRTRHTPSTIETTENNEKNSSAERTKFFNSNSITQRSSFVRFTPSTTETSTENFEQISSNERTKFSFNSNSNPNTQRTNFVRYMPSTTETSTENLKQMSTTERTRYLFDSNLNTNTQRTNFARYTSSTTEQENLEQASNTEKSKFLFNSNLNTNIQRTNYNRYTSSTTEKGSTSTENFRTDEISNERVQNKFGSNAERKIVTKFLPTTEKNVDSSSEYLNTERPNRFSFNSNFNPTTERKYYKFTPSTVGSTEVKSKEDLKIVFNPNSENDSNEKISRYNKNYFKKERPFSAEYEDSAEDISSERSKFSSTERDNYYKYSSTTEFTQQNSNQRSFNKFAFNSNSGSSTENIKYGISTTEKQSGTLNSSTATVHKPIFRFVYNPGPTTSTERFSSTENDSAEKFRPSSSTSKTITTTTDHTTTTTTTTTSTTELPIESKDYVSDEVTEKYKFVQSSSEISDTDANIRSQIFVNRNAKPFRATAEIPPVSEILATQDEPRKKEIDNPPTYKPKPFDANVNANRNASRNVTLPVRLSRVNTAIKSLTAFGGSRRNSQTPKCNENQTTPDTKCNEIQKQRTSTRGRGSAHYTSAGAGDNLAVNVNRGTPATPRSRPTLKPSTSIVSKASEYVDIYRYPPLRPDPIYPQPQVDKTAAKCRKDVCLLPDCYCGGKDIPGDLPVEQVPQIVLLTFDDSVNDLNKGLYSDLFEKGRTNPNGCPIAATFYVSHEWTDYSQVQNLYSDGHELASHTVSHSFGEQFSQKKWNREVAGQREILAAYGGVHLEDVRGMRAPFLSVGGNKMFKMLYDSNFTYDSSLPVYENRPPSWPYTLDYKLFHDCMIPPCPTRSYPGVWEVPMVMWQDLNGGRCSMGDACSNPPDADGVYKMLMKNFERHYTTNRAPFGLFYHAAWFTQPHHKEGFIKFLDFLVSKDDVYLTTNWQAIQWVRDPTPLNRIRNFPGFQCNYQDRPKRCNNPKVCNLWHKSGVRYMKTCQPCPDIYPWTGKTGIRSSRIDNDIED